MPDSIKRPAWTLNRKITVLFLVLGLCFALGGYAALKVTILPTFLEFEEAAARQDRETVSTLLDQALDEVRIMNLEYSVWDQTYEYVQGGRPQFVAENLDPSYWVSVDIDLMMIFDADGRRLSVLFSHPDDQSEVDIDWALDEPLTADHPLVRPGGVDDSVTGIAQTRLGPMLVTSFPILTSDGSGPVAGSLVTGQVITSGRVDAIADHSATKVAYHPTDLSDLDPRTAGAISRLIDSGRRAGVELHDDAIYSYLQLHDIFGQPAGVLEIVSPRELSRMGAAALRAAGWALAAAGAAFLLAALLFMNGLIVRPLRRLTDTILTIQRTGDLSVDIDHQSNDEVGALASEFNILTGRLNTVQLELEAARDAALESAKAKSEFLARMSHEIRTPMNGVIGMTELLRDTPLNIKQQRFAETIHDSADSLLAIINDILDFSKIEADGVRLEEIDVDLLTLLEETLDSVAMSAAAKNIELINQNQLALTHAVKTDPLRLRQILTNLLSNGIKFTARGEVVLSARVIEECEDSVRIHFEVRDTGIGIKPEKQQEIFGAFSQADGSTTRLYGGTGLGLAICRELVEMMGGSLSLESRPGLGSLFSFSLQLRRGQVIERPAVEHIRHIAGSRALIVDDNATNREILEHRLASWQASTASAVSADDALTQLEAAALAGEPFDFALLDVHMPEKDGIQLAEAIRARPALQDLRLVILSSIAESLSDERMRELRVAGQITKPVRQAHLYQTLVAMLSGTGPIACAQPRARQSFDGRILLAEDNPVNRLVAGNMLEKLGLEVVVAENGEEALQVFLAEPIDLILMDCQMPIMDGFEATQAIRSLEMEAGGHVPIVALTANALEGDREKCLLRGMDEYLSKPFTSEQMQSVLALFLNASGSRNDQKTGSELSGTADTGNDEQPALDTSVLQSLAGMQLPGDDGFLASVIDAYLHSSVEARERLAQAIAANDAIRVAEISHTLKSSSANVGALGLRELCERMEQLGGKENFAELAEVHEHFDREIERVFAALRHEMKSAAA